MALAVLGMGEDSATWKVTVEATGSHDDGAVSLTTATGTARVFFVANERAGVQLETGDVVGPSDADVIVVHATAPVPRMARSPRAAPGRTGHPSARNVGMADILRESGSAGILFDRVREEAAI